MSRWRPAELETLRTGWSETWPRRMQIAACPNPGCLDDGAFDHISIDEKGPSYGGSIITRTLDRLSPSIEQVRTTESSIPQISGGNVECRCGQPRHGEGVPGCGRKGFVPFSPP